MEQLSHNGIHFEGEKSAVLSKLRTDFEILSQFNRPQLTAPQQTDVLSFNLFFEHFPTWNGFKNQGQGANLLIPTEVVSLKLKL